MTEKTALITGASSGIGLKLAKIFADTGVNLVLVARNKTALDALKADIENKYSVNVMVLAGDLSIKGTTQSIYDALRAKNIPIDILVNNAGVGSSGAFADSDWLEQEALLELNINSLTHLTHLFLPEMLKKGQAHILNIASAVAFAPLPSMPLYAASKSFVLFFSKALRYQLKNTGVMVTAFCPGVTRSNFQKSASLDNAPMYKLNAQSPQQVAEYAYDAMIKNKKVAMPGFINHLLAIMAYLTPSWITFPISSRLLK